MAAGQSQSGLEKLEDIIKKQEEEIQKLETKAIQLINLYFVFQGVVLSSISSVTPVKCHNCWEKQQYTKLPLCVNL
jgi:hypothetical protein